ncbi:MAG: hypothetical protein R3A51_16885 [Nannocystaceae bacterium]|nr:hypothetical protein [Myxococcales bacterium]
MSAPCDARCPYCGRPLALVWVHGHGQCGACGTNVDECCRGELAVAAPGRTSDSRLRRGRLGPALDMSE